MIALIKKLFRKRRMAPAELWGPHFVTIGPVEIKFSGWEMAELASLYGAKDDGQEGLVLSSHIQNYRGLRAAGFVEFRTVWESCTEPDEPTGVAKSWGMLFFKQPRPGLVNYARHTKTPTMRVVLTASGQRFIEDTNERLSPILRDVA